MPTDNANVLTLVQAIGKFAQYLSEDGSTLSTDSRHELIRNAEKLAIAAREPDENLYFQATQVDSFSECQYSLLTVFQTAENAAIRTAIAMGVFEKVPSSGSGISATDLSTTLELDRDLLGMSNSLRKMKDYSQQNHSVRIMRACTSAHLFHEVSALHYTHNPLSSIFLEPPNRDMFKQMYDFVGQSVYNLPYFLKLTGYQNPTDYNDSAFQYGHRTNLGFWEYLKEDPERSKVFNSGMQSLATIGGAARSGGPYPFDKELENEEVSETDVVIVDVGGGRGQALEAIKVAFPELRGRMVLQDVENVIEDAKAGGLPDFIEPMVASFLELQPVKGNYQSIRRC